MNKTPNTNDINITRVARFLKMTLTPFSIFNVLYISTFGIYANKYIFRIIDAQVSCTPFSLILFFLLNNNNK